MEVRPVTLDGRYVRLEPLTIAHVPVLAEAIDADTFRYFSPDYACDGPPEAQAALYARLRLADPTSRPFAVIERASGRVVGATCYLDIRSAHRGLDRGDVLCQGGAKHARQPRMQTPAPRPRVRHAGVHPRAAEDRRAERGEPSGDPQTRREGRGHAAATHGDARRGLPRHGDVQHSRGGVGWGACHVEHTLCDWRLINLVRGEKDRFFECGKEVLVRLRGFDRLEVVLPACANQKLCRTPRPDGDGHAERVSVEFRGGHRADFFVGAVDDKSEILQCGDSGAEHFGTVGRVESSSLNTAESDLALFRSHDLTLRCLTRGERYAREAYGQNV